MLDIKYIREHTEELKKAIADKQLNPELIDNVLALDEQRRELIGKIQVVREESNAFQKQIKGKPTEEQITQGKQYKEKLADLEPQLAKIDEMFKDLMYQMPNPPAADVPVGTNESGNVEVRRVGEIREFDFEPKSHEELATALDLYDSKRATKIGGFRAYFLKNDLVKLEQAVLNFALNFMTEQGFTPMTVPWMVNKEALWGTGYFPWGIEDHYTTQDNQGL
ncbi:serine--tRNA ligase, partial [Candidatus Cerribacteria bacterium 'Amazon FNV 2010 28 9']